MYLILTRTSQKSFLFLDNLQSCNTFNINKITGSFELVAMIVLLFRKHYILYYRKVELRNGTFSTKVAHIKKAIYSLSSLQDIVFLANRRYIKFASTIEDKSVGVNNLNKISKNVKEKNRTYIGFNFFSNDDQQIFLAISRGEFNFV